MNRTTVANLGLLALALLVALAGGLDRRARDRQAAELPTATISSVQRRPLPGGGEAIVDGGGALVPLRPYHRILSTSLLSDRLLLELCEPDRIVGWSSASERSSPWRWRFAGKPAIDGMGGLEAMLALKPDLVLINVFGTDARIEKLRDAGVQVFNLGQLRGLATLLPMAEVIGALVGDAARGRAFAERFRARFDRVAAPLGDRPRRRGLYLAVIGNNIYGGTIGTSYHDVLVHGGLVDAAAGPYRDWPQYTAEQIAALDPDLVVTKVGMAEAVCSHPGLERIGACREPGHVLALPGSLVDEPGVAMLDAAELLFAAAYPGLAGAH